MQDVGHVGLHLCYLLHEAGAEILVADLNRDNLKRIQDELSVTDAASTDVLCSDVDVLAPCALGNVLSAETIPHVRAKVMAGAVGPSPPWRAIFSGLFLRFWRHPRLRS